MGQAEFIGLLAVYGVAFLGGLIALIRPIINLNVNIQKLTDAIENLNVDVKDLKVDVDKHADLLTDHETRLIVLENKGGK